jgi:acetyl esterase/lipase
MGAETAPRTPGHEAEPLGERVVAAMLRATLRVTLLRTFRQGRPVAQQRKRLALVSRVLVPPRGVRFEHGACGGVPGEFARAGGTPAPAAILYLHGGAYCVGSPATHRVITGNLARLAGASVFVADYRLAPEHPFPAALDDAVAAYRGLLQAGFDAGAIAIAGDSAGGGLTLATALRLRELGERLPAALVVFSPWVDLGSPDRGPVPHGEVMISPPWVTECAAFYLAGRPATEPLASPIHANLAGLPPVLVQVGSDEVLLDDSRRLRAALDAAGVPCDLQVYPRRWHVFQANAGMLADADRALQRTSVFLRECWNR